ncbi:DMT family transporter [Nonomuraea sp. NPDC003560]|uniref:DMT family transporter n=1 Tax=Nonomuraea sp. NPDC003560 TaxID=3364341 RepID=UPI00367B34EF
MKGPATSNGAEISKGTTTSNGAGVSNGAATSNGAPTLRDALKGTGAAARARQGTMLAFLGVLAFSGSFPGTVYAMRGFDPWLVAIGRAAVAGLIALVCLKAARLPLLPPRRHWPSYAVISLGVVFGFPVFSSLALDLGASTSHAAVVIALLPAATAACAVVRAGERPRPLFWAACAAGAAAIIAFTLTRGQAGAAWPDLLLVGALLSAALGYTEGGRLTRTTPGWQVISHALVLSLPLTAVITAVLALTTPITPTAPALAGFAYVALISMFLGFIPWYAGLARGGIARAGQTQLAQPLLTLIWAWVLMGERFGPATVAAALAVLACVAVTQRTRS